MSEFVNYWGGAGAWQSLKREHQLRLQTWAPTSTLEFGALFNDKTPLRAYQQLRAPVRLLLGEHSPAPVQVISNALANLLPECEFVRLSGMGHMGPLTHADPVARRVAAHIAGNSAHALNDIKIACPKLEVAA